jgi:hypothetical protein
MGTRVCRPGSAVKRRATPRAAGAPAQAAGREAGAATRRPRRHPIFLTGFWRASRRWLDLRVLRAGSSGENLVISGVRQKIVRRLFRVLHSGQPLADDPLIGRHSGPDGILADHRYQSVGCVRARTGQNRHAGVVPRERRAARPHEPRPTFAIASAPGIASASESPGQSNSRDPAPRAEL